jgi:hypothetical protein
MKHVILVFALFIAAACSSEKLDLNAAKKTAEQAIQYSGNKEFESLFTLYAKDFAASESIEESTQKLKKIIDVVGPVESYSLLDTLRVDETGQESYLVIKFKVKHSHTTTTETFNVVKEDGKYLLNDISITNQ